MLVSVSLIPPVTRISPSGRIETPGQNMLWAVLLTVDAVTAPVVRSRIAVCVYGEEFDPKLRSSSADQTTSLLPGISAAATGTSGKPIVGPHCPTIDGFVEVVVACAESIALRSCGVGRRAPDSTIRAAAIAVFRAGDTDSAVIRTARTSCALHATF